MVWSFAWGVCFTVGTSKELQKKESDVTGGSDTVVAALGRTDVKLTGHVVCKVFLSRHKFQLGDECHNIHNRSLSSPK